MKSQAKFEPDVFRNSLYKYFETIQPGDWDGYLSSLDKAGNTVRALANVARLPQVHGSTLRDSYCWWLACPGRLVRRRWRTDESLFYFLSQERRY